MSREHARALRILQDHGADEERATNILRAFASAGIHLYMTEPVIEPNAGPRSEDPNPHVDKLRAIVRAATKPTEHEENEA